MDKVLAVDDDQAILHFLFVSLMQTEKYEVKLMQDSTKVFEELEHNFYDLILLDMDMPEVTGLDILRHVRKTYLDVETIILTGVDDVQLAVEAMKLGAYDYLTKPVDKDLILLVIERAMERRHLKNQVYELRKDFRFEDLKNREAFKDIFTRSGSMIKILHYIEKISNTRSSVLIWGESGTGKELIAKAIHAASPRKDKKFIAVNAGVFATELFPSEFFGHVKGSFTGAYTDKKGFIEEADGGTLFLDEIGELSLPIQVKLLRVLQEREFFRMGSTQSTKVDTRIIACTNKDLQVEIEKGNFRKDLFYRLNISSIHIPPLREHKEDIPLLSHHFIEKYNKINRKDINGIPESLMELLQNYDYPGNVRELENIINHMVSVESSKRLREESLPQYFIESITNNHKCIPFSFGETSLMNVQREHIKNILEHTEGNRTKAANILGISRVNLISKIKKYKL